MSEKYIDSKRKQTRRGCNLSAELIGEYLPLPRESEPQKIVTNIDTLIVCVLRKVMPMSISHTVILTESAVLSRGYFNFVNPLEKENEILIYLDKVKALKKKMLHEERELLIELLRLCLLDTKNMVVRLVAIPEEVLHFHGEE